MKTFSRQLAAFAGVGALASVGLFAAVSPNRHTSGRQDRFIGDIETVLSMTAAQKDATHTAIVEARQAATPIRQELMNTNNDLQSAVKSDNTALIQHLSTTEGQEIGQLLAIRSSAVAKVYSALTPEQRVKADALHGMLMQAFRRPAEHANSAS